MWRIHSEVQSSKYTTDPVSSFRSNANEFFKMLETFILCIQSSFVHFVNSTVCTFAQRTTCMFVCTGTFMHVRSLRELVCMCVRFAHLSVCSFALRTPLYVRSICVLECMFVRSANTLVCTFVQKMSVWFHRRLFVANTAAKHEGYSFPRASFLRHPIHPFRLRNSGNEPLIGKASDESLPGLDQTLLETKNTSQTKQETLDLVSPQPVPFDS